MNDEVTEEKEKTKVNGSKKKRIAIMIIIALIAIIAIIAIAVRSNVTSVGVEETEQLATLKVSSDGTYKLTVVNYASSGDSNGEQNFIIQKTDEYGNPLQGVEFEIAGNFRTSYTVEFYDADNSNAIMSDYTQVFYGSHWDDKYITTDEKGKISLTLQYGDYVIAESKSLYGYEEDDNIYCIRVDKSGINIIDESKVDWDDANFDETGTINVSTASIKDTLGNISGYALDHIELNGTNLGTSEDNLPTTVNDGDVIKIYMSVCSFSYNLHFLSTVYDRGESCNTFNSFNEIYSYTVNNPETGYIDGYKLFYIDYDLILDISKAIYDEAYDYDYDYQYIVISSFIVYDTVNETFKFSDSFGYNSDYLYFMYNFYGREDNDGDYYWALSGDSEDYIMLYGNCVYTYYGSVDFCNQYGNDIYVILWIVELSDD